MARRKNSRRSLGLIVGALAILGVLTLLGPRLLDPHRTKPRLNLSDYLENPQAFSGNTYFLEGLIQDRLARSPAGSVYALGVSDHLIVPLLVPQQNAPAFNLEKGQHLAIDFRVADDGSLVATHLAKK